MVKDAVLYHQLHKLLTFGFLICKVTHVKGSGWCLVCGKHTEATVLMLVYKGTEGDKHGTHELTLTWFIRGNGGETIISI